MLRHKKGEEGDGDGGNLLDHIDMQMINNFNDGRGNFQFFTMKSDPSLKLLTQRLHETNIEASGSTIDKE